MNDLKGEVLLKAGNKEYTLKFTTNALCELENRLDKGINEIIIAASKDIPSLNTVRCLLFCACMEHHKKEVQDLEAAGHIIDAAGYKETWATVVEAIAACLPDKVEGQKKTKVQGKYSKGK